jgi:pectinesterase
MKPVRAGVFALAALVSGAVAAQTAALPKPVQPYTAETTYAKLVKKYPFIHIASSEVPPTVRALTNITYVRHGDRALQLDLYLPAHPSAAPLPGIVFVHGGGWSSGVRENFAPIAIRMAEHGYAAATISYRLSPESQFPAAIQDAKAAVKWMRANAARYGIDGGRIAIGGASAGGQIASLAGVSAGVARFEPEAGAVAGADGVSSAVQAIVNIDGLSDFTDEAARKYEDDPTRQPTSADLFLGGRYAEKPEVWRAASPLFYVNAATPPILFIGSAQPRFSVGREAMVEKMKAQGIPSQVVLLPDTPHSFWLMDPWFEPTVKAAIDFLDRNLRAKPAAR